jgi:hypothetical protein
LPSWAKPTLAIPHAATQWESDAAYSWAVCEPTTGELLAEIVLDPVTGTIRSRARSGHGDVAAAAEESVRRFATAALGIAVGP